MDRIKLPPRLAAIAALVPFGARLADVGTDHGLLPLFLLRENRISSAVATDIRPGPLSRAESNAEALGENRLRCVLCDGLSGLPAGAADTVVIAGMGGENIAQILRAAPWTHTGTLLLLQPMSRPEELRSALIEMQIKINRELLVRDAGRIYPILCARGGTPAPHSRAELLTGRYELVSGEPLFVPALEEWIRRLDASLRGLEKSAKPEDQSRLAALRQIRREIEEMRDKNADSI